MCVHLRWSAPGTEVAGSPGSTGLALVHPFPSALPAYTPTGVDGESELPVSLLVV